MTDQCSAEAVINRIKSVVNIDSNRKLSAYFGLASSNISNKQQRNSIPIQQAIQVALAHDISLDWLILGREYKTRADIHTLSPETTRAESALSEHTTTELVRGIVAALESGLNAAGLTLPPDKKADLVATLFDMSAEQQTAPSRDNIIRLVRNMAS